MIFITVIDTLCNTLYFGLTCLLGYNIFFKINVILTNTDLLFSSTIKEFRYAKVESNWQVHNKFALYGNIFIFNLHTLIYYLKLRTKKILHPVFSLIIHSGHSLLYWGNLTLRSQHDPTYSCPSNSEECGRQATNKFGI